ncbi:MAG: DUF6794 domain-containing protein [Fimbriimonas sp.]
MPSLLPKKILAVGLLTAVSAWSICQNSEERLTPTKDVKSSTGVLIPKDLEAAMKELDKLLPPKMRAAMTKGTEDDMIVYHHGLGTWLRNNWGLWGQSALAKWFAQRGIFHPDDMSGIVLDSYWRRLHKRPIDLEGQIAHYQEYWKREKEADAKREAQTARALVAIPKMMMGLTVAPSTPSTVRIPHAPFGSDFEARYAAPFAEGVLLSGKRYSAIGTRRRATFRVVSYFFDLRTRKLRLATLPEGDDIEDSVVIGGKGFFNCFGSQGRRILRIDGGKRSFIPWPSSFASKQKEGPRLGIERSPQGDAIGLLALGTRSAARWTGSRWEILRTGGVELPRCVQPPEKVGDRLLFREEESRTIRRDGMAKRLFWIDLAAPRGLVGFVKSAEAAGFPEASLGHVWAHATTPDGALWVTSGGFNTSLIRRSSQGKFSIATFNNSILWKGGVDPTVSTDVSEDVFAVTGLEPQGDGSIKIVGNNDLSLIQSRQIQRLLRFEGAPSDWNPSQLLTLSPTLTLAAGQNGGLVLIEKGKDGGYTATVYDDRIGAPRVF